MHTAGVITRNTVTDRFKSFFSTRNAPADRADRHEAMETSGVAARNIVADKFKDFLSIITMPADRHEAIDASARGVARRINDTYWPFSSNPRHLQFIGSYGRDTAMKDLTNIQVLIILPPSLYRQFHSYRSQPQMRLIRGVADVLTPAYKDTQINNEGRLLIPFDKGYQFEIIPGFTNQKNTITYPDLGNGGHWKYFNPLKEIEAINHYNFQYGGKVKHLARMMRAWKTQYKAPIPAMLIDTLVVNFMEDWEGGQTSFGYYGHMVQDFLEYMAGLKKEQGHWYARGSNREIFRHEDFGVQADMAYKKAAMANQYESEAKQLEANLCWREVFGDLFPNTSCLG